MAQATLFKDQAPQAAPHAGYARVAIERALDRVLDYSVPQRLAPLLSVGQRVRVPLGRGNHPTHGWVVGLSDSTDIRATKPISAVDDDRVLVTPPLMQLALWMSRYYCTPLGTVLESVIPSAVKKRIGLDYVSMVRLAVSRAAAQEALEKTKAAKRRAVLARLLQLAQDECIELARLAGQAGCTPATVRTLLPLGLITVTSQPDFASFLPDADETTIPPELRIPPTLNEDQQRVFDELAPRVGEGSFSVNLLHGVTGSGKTEIYLRCIRQVVDRGRQAIVLVPEIALTPQTVARFAARFERVAVLHSGLTASQRHAYWQQTWQGQADVVVGARSAVFSPLQKLGMIVVDEEHDASYKQDTAPRYHGRDVAVKRAQIEGVPILLGSATPSLEMYWRVTAVQNPKSTIQNERYHLLSLPHRVRGLSLPTVELVDMRREVRIRGHIHLFSKRLEVVLGQALEQGRQAILLINRRGYSNFVYCPSCHEPITCRFCDVTMTYHRTVGAGVHTARVAQGVHTGQLICHYCLAVNPLPPTCPDCGKLLTLFGLGTQRVEEEMERRFPGIAFARVDSDSMHSTRDYQATLDRFGRGEIQVLLGTQMIAKGLDYPNVTLVGVISADTALALPDFRSAERTFQLITQVAGRAGRGDWGGRVVVQTLLPDDPAIRTAIRQDFLAFAQGELANRRQVGLPPFERMVRIVLRDQDDQKLQALSQEVASELAGPLAAQGNAIRVRGPHPCPITRIAGYYRHQIVLYSASPAALQTVLANVRSRGALATSDRIAVDVDPVSLL